MSNPLYSFPVDREAFKNVFGAYAEDLPMLEIKKADNVYEMYFRRGFTYYFRNSDGHKMAIKFSSLQPNLKKGYRMKVEANPNFSAL